MSKIITVKSTQFNKNYYFKIDTTTWKCTNLETDINNLKNSNFEVFSRFTITSLIQYLYLLDNKPLKSYLQIYHPELFL